MEKNADLLNLTDAATYLSTSRGTLWKLIREGEIPVAHIRGLKRIRKSDLDALVESKLTGGAR